MKDKWLNAIGLWMVRWRTGGCSPGRPVAVSAIHSPVDNTDLAHRLVHSAAADLGDGSGQ